MKKIFFFIFLLLLTWQNEVNAKSDSISTPAKSLSSIKVSSDIDDSRQKSDDEIFYESFDKNNSKGGNDGNYSGESGIVVLDNTEKATSKTVTAAYKCIELGTNSYEGYFSISSLDNLKSDYGRLVFKLMGQKANSTCRILFYNVKSGRLKDKNGWEKQVVITPSEKSWSTVSIPFMNITSTPELMIAGQRIYIDSVAIESYPKNIPVNIGVTGYASLYYGNYGLKVPDDVKSFTMKVAGDEIVENHVYASGDIIPQATAVVMNAKPGTYNFVVSTDDNGTVDDDNQLRGSDIKQQTTGGDVYYMLAINDDNKAGFYWASKDGEAFVNGAHKAYLALPSGYTSSAKSGFTFNEDNSVTGIKMHNVDAKEKDIIYNTLGQRVDKDYKGIVIRNGRKFIRR